MWAANAPTNEITAKAKTNGTTSLLNRSIGRVNPHARPIINYAELAGKNSCLEALSQEFGLFALSVDSLGFVGFDIYYGII
jgi:hypothetical protein